MGHYKNIILILLFSSILPFYCQAQEKINIGVILADTGDWQNFGTNCKNAIRLAESESDDGKHFFYESSPNATPQNAVLAYRRLTQRYQPKVFIGPTTPEELAALTPLINRDNTFLMSVAPGKIHPNLSHTVYMDPEEEARRIADFVLSKSQRNIAILSSGAQWEVDVSSSFQKRINAKGGKIVLYEEPTTTTQDVNPQVLRLIKSGADAVFIPSYMLLPLYLKAMQTLKVSLPAYSLELDSQIIRRMGEAAEALIYITPFNENSSFYNTYKSRYNREAELPAAQCYDAAKILVNAVKNVGQDSRKIYDHIKADQNIIGASGKIMFTDKAALFDTAFFQVQNGTAHRIAAHW